MNLFDFISHRSATGTGGHKAHKIPSTFPHTDTHTHTKAQSDTGTKASGGCWAIYLTFVVKTPFRILFFSFFVGCCCCARRASTHLRSIAVGRHITSSRGSPRQYTQTEAVASGMITFFSTHTHTHSLALLLLLLPFGSQSGHGFSRVTTYAATGPCMRDGGGVQEMSTLPALAQVCLLLQLATLAQVETLSYE